LLTRSTSINFRWGCQNGTHFQLDHRWH